MLTVPLTKGAVALLDECDADLTNRSWCLSSAGYAKRGVSTPKCATIYLHREVAARMAELSKGLDVDHINGDTLDNRRSNLRVVTHAENLRNRNGAQANNTSGYVGVRPKYGGRRWVAEIAGEYIGSFKTREEAATARLAAEKEKWGVQPRREWEYAGC